MIDLSYFVTLAYNSGKEVVMVWYCYGLIVALQYPVANHSYLRIIPICESFVSSPIRSRSIEVYRGLSRPIQGYPGLAQHPMAPRSSQWHQGAPNGTKELPMAPRSSQWHQGAPGLSRSIPGLSLGYPDPITSYPHPLIFPLFHAEHSNTNSNANHSYYHLYSAYAYN